MENQLSYTNWRSGEPNNHGNEDCIRTYNGAGEWIDDNCYDKYGGTSASAEREMPVVGCEYALLPAPSADLPRISRVPRGAIADWEEEPFPRLRGPTCLGLPTHGALSHGFFFLVCGLL